MITDWLLSILYNVIDMVYNILPAADETANTAAHCHEIGSICTVYSTGDGNALNMIYAANTIAYFFDVSPIFGIISVAALLFGAFLIWRLVVILLNIVLDVLP